MESIGLPTLWTEIALSTFACQAMFMRFLMTAQGTVNCTAQDQLIFFSLTVPHFRPVQPNSESNTEFLKYLHVNYPQQRLAVFRDGASYHRSVEVKTYLQTVNQDLAQAMWAITCTRFAPNAPEQNPVEDVWLQAKRFVRQYYHLCKSFAGQISV